jgi:hypothetical protein
MRNKMKINLRKSSAIQKELFVRVGKVEFDTTVELDEFNDPKDVISKQLNEVTDNIIHKQNLLSILYSLRAKTGIVNAKAGVSGLLAEQERVRACVRMYESFSTSKPRLDLVELQQRIEKIKKLSEKEGDRLSYHSSRDHITSSVFDKEQLDVFKNTVKQLKKQHQEINDQLLEINVKKTIELSSEEEELLSNEGLL